MHEYRHRRRLHGASAGTGLTSNPDFVSSHDGMTYTLMLSENLQGGNWALDPSSDPALGGMNKSFYNTDMGVRANTGMVWFLNGNYNNRSIDGQSNSTTTQASVPGSVQASMVINAASSQMVVGSITVPFSASSGANPSGLAYSRPSSNHPGGVNVAYCGGNAGYLSDEIDYAVFTQLMTPNQQKVNVAPAGSGALLAITAWNYPASGIRFYILDESEF